MYVCMYVCMCDICSDLHTHRMHTMTQQNAQNDRTVEPCNNFLITEIACIHVHLCTNSQSLYSVTWFAYKWVQTCSRALCIFVSLAGPAKHTPTHIRIYTHTQSLYSLTWFADVSSDMQSRALSSSLLLAPPNTRRSSASSDSWSLVMYPALTYVFIIHVCMYVYMYINIHLYMYNSCMYVNMYVYIYTP